MSLRTVGDLLPGLLDRYGLSERLAGWRAVAAWSEVVGEPLARKSRAVSFKDGVLLVEVEGSAWMQELGFLKSKLIARINQRLGAHPVRGVHLVARGGTQR
jgi:predicted nucleic acid-binding Zn ribbon protein